MTTKVAAAGASLYGPVAADLALVEDTLDRIKHVENFPALSQMLAHVLAGAASGCGRRSRCWQGTLVRTSATCMCRWRRRSNCCIRRRSCTTT